jgi:cyclic dehypoxanthinyl futalosine synthase
MMEENVVSSAGTTYCLNEAVLCRLIRDAGYTPAQRDNTYDILRVHDRALAGVEGRCPDLAVTDWPRHRARRLHAEAAKEPLVELKIGVDAAT